MRTTFNAMYREAGAGIETASQRLAEFQRQVSTGKRLEKPSDDPSGTSTAIGEHAAIATVEQYSRAATSVGSKLTVIDTLLSDMVDKISSASTAVMSARGSTQSPAQREAAALQLEAARDALFDDFNASFQGAHIFGGAAATTPPFVRNGSGTVQPYAGSTTEVRVDVDRNRAVTTAINGDAIARGSSAEDIFAVLDGLIAAARSGDSDALGAGGAKLKEALNRVTTAQSRVGADMGIVDDQKLRLGQMKIAATARLDKVEAANMVEAISGMNQSQAAYEAALGAVGAVTRVSLMDYLK
jgi:flagellar hook-associated protein 3 FlgL